MLSNVSKLILSIIGIIVGICTISIGTEVTTHDITRVSNITYGGDAYTGIQNAAAATANNVRSIYMLLTFVISPVLIISGVLIIIHYLKELEESVNAIRLKRQ